MNKRFLLLMLFSLNVMAVWAQYPAKIKIKGKGLKAEVEVVLSQIGASGVRTEVTRDKTNAKGDFSISVSQADANFYTLDVQGIKQTLLLTGSDLNVSFSGDEVVPFTVTGTADADLLLKIQKVASKERALLKELEKRYEAADAAAKQQIEQEYTQLLAASEQERVQLVQQGSGSLATVSALQFLDLEKYQDLHLQQVERLQQRYVQNALLQAHASRLEKSLKLQNGQPAPEITLPSVAEGTSLSLSSLKGKVVLIDFWASWCGPCRKENPHVVALYEQYKDRGFDIFSVSLDKDKDAWLKAIEKDGLKWSSHVSDLKGWQCEGAAIYNVSSIPMTYLLDREGKIIAKGLRGEALSAKLAELLGAQ